MHPSRHPSLAALCRLIISSAFVILHCASSVAQNVRSGEKLFDANCAGCHNFKQDGIGPQLGGLKNAVDRAYLVEFIKSPKAQIDARVARALDKAKKFGTVMPDFKHLTSAELDDLVAYIFEKPAPVVRASSGKVALENPIISSIPQSSFALNLQKVMQFPFTNKTQPRTRINKMGFHPITKETMVSDLQGKIYILTTNNQPDVFFDAAKHFKNFINTPGLATGLGSFAFHPDYARNGLFYTTHTEPKNSATADFSYADSIPIRLQWVVNEWTVTDPRSRVLTGKPRELLRVNVVDQIHGMQEIAFNPYATPKSLDYGLLYIGIGDGGAVEKGYPFIARDKNHIWSKVLRIDPTGRTSKNGQYGIPKTNPFVGKDGLDEVYAAGFRNPNRISWTKDGKMLVSNIGQRQIESVYLVKPGKNYGWPDREGTFLIDSTANVNSVYPLPKNDARYGYSYPVAQFDHDEGNAIMGGFEYTGRQIPALAGKYVFGEIVRGRVFYVNLNEIREGAQATIHEFPLRLDGQQTTLKELSKATKVDFRIGQDADGELYLMTKSDGMLYKVVK
ncbi:PQQ-dependent sugar dehydrogenase [Spirosoma sp.]|uniref:PQQ-dependent sugar dehydrogenase n=1 Tax=Spirosoma sp. TaxID=1899569 RepID=UPI00261242BB|nr:PQQ-dependent sugar dehydrogenase [Spirosoma sp.]MCX6213182.1 PQQ-dependent sugar dehydrogenase [Spirosoma sp.]